MKQYLFSLLIFLALVVSSRAAQAATPEAIHQAVDRSLPLLQKSLNEYPKHAPCFACHHQGAALFTLGLATKHGYTVEKKSVDDAVKHTATDLQRDIALYQKGQGQPGGVTRAGYALFALQSGGYTHDTITTAVTDFLLQRDRARGFWNAASHRPPSEQSSFTDTFIAIRALKSYADESHKEAVAERIGHAREWLEKTAPVDTEDRVFQLWGMQEAGTEKATLRKAAQALLMEQQKDGGWAQLPGTSSDAYATGTVLTALCLAGSLTTDDPAYQRGVQFLLNGQQPDGSWHVVTRSKPVQPYFESGFPHGKDQFISMSASSWATTALILATAPGH